MNQKIIFKDVGDGYRRRCMLVTAVFGRFFALKKSSTIWSRRKHLQIDTIIKSSAKHCHQHHCSPVFCHESVSIMTHLWHSMMVTPVRANEWYYKIAIASPSGQRNLSVMCWVHRIKWDLRHSENEFLNIPSTSRRPCFSIDEISARTPSLWQFELQISQFTPYTYTIMTHLWYW